MVSLTRWAAVSGLVLGLVLSVNSLNASTMNRTEYLKFNAPVALPGVTLSPGTYSFELADSSNPSLVIVRDRNTRQPKFLGFTYRVPRPASARDMKSTVILGEARRGEATPIRAWFPVDADTGYEFIYRNHGK